MKSLDASTRAKGGQQAEGQLSAFVSFLDFCDSSGFEVLDICFGTLIVFMIDSARANWIEDMALMEISRS
jgi:hypothetical protein